MLLKNAVVYRDDFAPAEVNLEVTGERISSVDAGDAAGEALDLAGCTLLPGFIDIHVHGCAGYDMGDGTPEALRAMSDHLLHKGITSFCPTSMTLGADTLARLFANVAACMGGEPGAYIQGINMEGPYIAPSKKGAQNAAFIRRPDKDEFRRLYDGCGGIIRVVDIAPEEEGAEAFIREVQPYCPVSIAHTAANYEQAMQAIEWGARHFTHLFNAMNGLSHRAPGVVGAAFDAVTGCDLHAELICDGFHIHPAALRIAFRALGEDHTVIVSDAMCAAGAADGEDALGGQTVTVKDGKALLADGTIAASTTNLWDEFQNVLRFGIPFRQALKSVTINPARAIRADRDTGSLAVGKYADLIAVDGDGRLRLVMVKGRIKLRS